MPLPFFYISDFTNGNTSVMLDEVNSRHAIQVLRLSKGDRIELTDGKGHSITGVISDDHRKHSAVTIEGITFHQRKKPIKKIAVSLLKNTSRFEWFLEKAAELGISEIVALQTARTEKEKFRFDRLNNILISAMLQSGQYWLTELHEPVSFGDFLKSEHVTSSTMKFIAHCADDVQKTTLASYSPFMENSIVLIGPEGDFTVEEIAMATTAGFQPVSLGTTRLRTETAALTASVILMQ